MSAAPAGPVELQPAEELRETLEVSLVGVARVTGAFLPLLRRELAPLGVDVCVVEPGSARTPIWEKMAGRSLDRYRGSPYERRLLMLRERALAGGERGLEPEVVARALEED